MPHLSLSCLFDPLGCATSALDAQPWYVLLLAGIVIGMLLGAWLGKLGVGAVIAGVIGILLFWRQRGPVAIEEGDMDPPARPTKRKPKPRPESWIDIVRRGDKPD